VEGAVAWHWYRQAESQVGVIVSRVFETPAETRFRMEFWRLRSTHSLGRCLFGTRSSESDGFVDSVVVSCGAVEISHSLLAGAERVLQDLENDDPAFLRSTPLPVSRTVLPVVLVFSVDTTFDLSFQSR